MYWPILNLTVKKVLTARSHYNQDKVRTWTIAIDEHQNMALHGCAVLATSEDLYQLIMLFIAEIR